MILKWESIHKYEKQKEEIKRLQSEIEKGQKDKDLLVLEHKN